MSGSNHPRLTLPVPACINAWDIVGFMIFQVNHMGKGRGELISRVVSRWMALAGEGKVHKDILPHLHVQLDWVQYKSNFREAAMVRKSIRNGEPSPLVEIAIDLRQVDDETLDRALETAAAEASPGGYTPPRVVLEEFGSMRASMIWAFNKLYWQHRTEWEEITGESYEKALPSGSSDGHNVQAIQDQVVEFYDLLVDMDAKRQLSDEIYLMEIGVGNGQRALLWLDSFLKIDREKGAGYYPKLRYLLCDYSMVALERALERLGPHREVAVPREVDAMDPFRALSELRYKVLYIHLTNVYDNLPTDDAVLRDGRIYLIEIRSYLKADDVEELCRTYGFRTDTFAETVRELLDVGPRVLDDPRQGMRFWMALWSKLHLEERMVTVDSLSEASLPSGLKPSHLEELVTSGPGTVRFQLSSGAVGSFASTIPLLHPRGYLQVMDIFVTELTQYRGGFKGPGKMDGSVVNWVNGALLAEVGKQAGYDVHFNPFTYREGSRTSILYTTHRER